MSAKTKKAGAAAAASAPAAGGPAAAPAPAEQPQGSGGAESTEVTLLGTNALEALVMIGDKEFQLGDIVAAAQSLSGLTVESWNALDEATRDKILLDYVQTLRDEAKAAADAAAEEAARAQAEAEAAAAAQAAREAAEAEAAAAQAQAAAAAEAAEQAAREAAEAEAASRAAQEPAASETPAPAPEYPKVLEVGNNAGLSLAEPITGALLKAGDLTPITVNSEQQEHNVRQNLAELLRVNYLSKDALTVTVRK